MIDPATIIKCVVVGDSGVGKSSLLLRYANDEFDEFSQPTLGAAFVSKVQTIQGKQIKFQIWDTAGQQKYKSIAPIYYKQSEVALCVYDISNKNSFAVMSKWVKQLQDHGPENMTIAVIGNKIDKTDEEEVSYQEGKDFADSIQAIFKLTSAKQGKGISELFNSIGDQYLQKQNTQRQRSMRQEGNKQEGVHLRGEEGKKKKGGCCKDK